MKIQITKLLLLFVFLLVPAIVFAQPEIKTYVEVMPEFPGGQPAMMQFLQKNLRYPKEARKNKIEGRVVAQFVVRNDGRLAGLQILRSIGYGCDEEVLRILKLMPEWTPGKQNGDPVNVYFKLPVTFKLGSE